MVKKIHYTILASIWIGIVFIGFAGCNAHAKETHKSKVSTYTVTPPKSHGVPEWKKAQTIYMKRPMSNGDLQLAPQPTIAQLNQTISTNNGIVVQPPIVVFFPEGYHRYYTNY